MFNPMAVIRFVGFKFVLVGLMALLMPRAMALRSAPQPAPAFVAVPASTIPGVGGTGVAGSFFTGHPISGPIDLGHATTLDQWVHFDVFEGMRDYLDVSAPRPVVHARRIVFAGGRLIVDRRGVIVDGQRMDHGDLALRALLAWLSNSHPGIACGSMCSHIGDIAVGGTYAAGVRFEVNGVTRLTIPREPGADDIPRAIDRNVTYVLFMHWLNHARAGDPLFAQALCKRDMLCHDSLVGVR